MRVDTAGFFWARVDRSEDADACWNWTGVIDQLGYGSVSHREYSRAHRMSWAIHNGPIPTGLYVLHHCDNRRCVNPSHLYVGTHRDNMDDVIERERSIGIRRDTVEAVRKSHADGVSYRQLMRQFGLSRTSLINICHKRGRFARL